MIAPVCRTLVIVMRGLPGSGKSSWCAQFLRRNWPKLSEAEYQQLIFSTDNYFFKDGLYCFDAEKLPYYHAKNLAAFTQALQKNPVVLICDNTNLQQCHWQPYLDAAAKVNANSRVVLLGEPSNAAHQKDCAERNLHNVSLQTIAAMAKKCDPF